MKPTRRRTIALGAGLLGVGITVLLLLPLPPANDIYAARRWGVGVGYVGFILGFPLGIIGVPTLVALHPYPVGTDASGASTVLTMVAGLVGTNWALMTVGLMKLVRRFRTTRTNSLR
jgi:hypothetical protein